MAEGSELGAGTYTPFPRHALQLLISKTRSLHTSLLSLCRNPTCSLRQGSDVPLMDFSELSNLPASCLAEPLNFPARRHRPAHCTDEEPEAQGGKCLLQVTQL